ncbi:orotidine-5'-phosphate decarboxylase [Diaminobutyricimonas sp. TR449]|uniref:orotidine-5'-phosphate decarboxylase n=1 Tax=Diaminobutyricimonas sp. TR449 TaxID=2708076 RepID=UPI001FBA046D|nr:orotidine-5'-phosphate decarboxylase [Diaminobutyricimonas sp. TR449]
MSEQAVSGHGDQGFGARLRSTLTATGHLCVGIDPHPHLLRDWELDDSAAGVREFGLRVVDAAAQAAGIVKPQVAFFERFGADGFRALEEVIRAAREAGLLVIADAKRGDVGSTVEAYGRAWLEPGSPLEADALTVSAFQGTGSLSAVRELASANGKGLFVLAATSNPESFPLQRASTADGTTVSRIIATEVAEWNRGASFGSFGVVIGATVDLDVSGLSRDALVGMPILAPGFGHQGADIRDIRAIYGDAADSVLVSMSRSILKVGPTRLSETIRNQSAEVAECLE